VVESLRVRTTQEVKAVAAVICQSEFRGPRCSYLSGTLFSLEWGFGVRDLEWKRTLICISVV
jgi:hypothetical protein